MGFPIVIQHHASDCGPAVLAMMAAFYGRRISIARLREMAATNSRGTTLAGLIRAAEQIGFHARGVRATSESLHEVSLPAIAHWKEHDQDHFVVLCEVDKNSAVIADPICGLRRLSFDDFGKNWSGVLLILNLGRSV